MNVEPTVYHYLMMKTQSKGVTDKKIRVDLAVLRETLLRKEIIKLTWITSYQQVANPLMKKGSSSFGIIGLLVNNKQYSKKLEL